MQLPCRLHYDEKRFVNITVFFLYDHFLATATRTHVTVRVLIPYVLIARQKCPLHDKCVCERCATVRPVKTRRNYLHQDGAWCVSAPKAPFVAIC